MTEANTLFEATTTTGVKKRPMYKAGWHQNLSNDEYHGSSGYSSSLLKILTEKTMAHLLYKQSQPNEYTEATLKGQALHTLTLEPHLFDSEFAVRPEGLKKPTSAQINAAKPSPKSQQQMNEWSAWLDELGDRTEITEEMRTHALAMSKKVREHPKIAGFMDEKMKALVEQSVYYWYNPEDWDQKDDYRIMCKVRPDLVIPGHPIIFDLKSTRDASFTEFMRQAKKLGYHISAAMYLDGLNRCKPFLKHCGVTKFEKFVWICVENTPPFEVAIYEIRKEDLDLGASLYHKAVRRMQEYNVSDWKGYGEFNGTEVDPCIRMSEFPPYGSKVI